MKVKELIEELKKQDPEMIAYTWDSDKDRYYEITKVSITGPYNRPDEDGVEII